MFQEHPEFLELSDAGVREGRTRLGVVDDRVVGFASLRGGPPAFELEDLFVDPDWMRRGVARALVADLSERAHIVGATCIEVDANPHAWAFYESAGFVSIGEAALEHGTGARMRLSVEPTRRNASP